MTFYTIEELRARKTNAITAMQAIATQENTAWREYVRLKEARLAAAKAYEEAVRAVQRAEAAWCVHELPADENVQEVR